MICFAGKCNGEGDCFEDTSFPNGYRCECYSGFIGEQCASSLDVDSSLDEPQALNAVAARSNSALPPGASEELDVGDDDVAYLTDISDELDVGPEAPVEDNQPQESGVYFNSVCHLVIIFTPSDLNKS